METECSRLVDALPGLVWTANPDGRVDFLNGRWRERTGFGLNERRGDGWTAVIHPDDLHRFLEGWRALVASGKAGEMEARLRTFDGKYRWFLFRACPIADASGAVVEWCGIGTDIEERRRAEEELRAREERFRSIVIDDLKRTQGLLAGENRVLEMAASGHSLHAILEALCRLVEETIDGCHCCILVVDPTGTRLMAGASPTLPTACYDPEAEKTVHPDDGPCGMAASLKIQVIVADMASETRWDANQLRVPALAHGLKACWSTPILSRTHEVLGTFAIHLREAGVPAVFEQDLISQCTHIASIAIERAKSDAALEQSEAFLAKAQHLCSTGSFSWRVKTDEVTWSEDAYQIFELDPLVPMTPQRIRTRVHPEDLPLFDAAIERARATGGDLEHEQRLLMPDGSVKHVRIVANATRHADGKLEYIGAIQDVTQRRLSEEALGRARSELARVARVSSLGALAASIAHEVNQPLSGIITNASTCLRMLAAEPANLEGARETARRTIRDGERASHVIARLRGLYCNRATTSESVDLNEAATEVIALSASELRRNGVMPHTELADGLPCVTGDRIQLQQVILNLLLNASEAMSGIEERPRQLVVKTERDEEDCVRLSVRDAGAGFVPRDVGKLFEAFYTTKDGGMGMGLSISRTIIESHQGRLWAAPNDGPGATFSFSIPACRAPETTS